VHVNYIKPSTQFNYIGLFCIILLEIIFVFILIIINKTNFNMYIIMICKLYNIDYCPFIVHMTCFTSKAM
jgi:hypothetical protein